MTVSKFSRIVGSTLYPKRWHHFHLSCHMHDFGRACFCVTSFQKAKGERGCWCCVLVLLTHHGHSGTCGTLLGLWLMTLACCMLHVACWA